MDLCSCGEACEVQGGEKGRGLNTYRCQGRKSTGEARDTLGLEILSAADHKAYYQHNQHIAQIFKFILDSYKMVEVLMKISF